ncbi:MAG: polysaccharide deacetylase family protein [Bacteroidia bacterium]|nr:polysaccharide deacetylase family protein [Bacteroidia bacterium]MDW8057077.1 polysaccharide deacetylase family protein [Bacteroidia bacterium]
MWRLSRLSQRLMGAYIPPVPSEQAIYLTFDDGPSSSTAPLLDILGLYGFRATFFWLWSRYSEKTVSYVLPLLQQHGHRVALHGMRHYSAWRSFPASGELLRAFILWKKTGVPLIPAFRPPYGHWLPFSAPAPLQLVLWDIMPPDYIGKGGWESQLLRQLRPGWVVVLHERTQNIPAWRRFFSRMFYEGWRAVPLPLAPLESPAA